ncbi:MAG: DeoR/GlpR family DNA-binding transcription regulator [Intestinimonas sp.]|nr:DeoR/GlpR family DNA-binding transcription regulator [Intestinimonas sp.]
MNIDGADERAALLAPERRARILALVVRNKSMLVKDLCALFHVTGETIRKDLATLEREGKLIKTHGGAYVQEGVRNEVDLSIRASLLPRTKDAIGRACAALVREGDTIFLDESTTCLAIARHLLRVEGLTVLTNSLAIAGLFAEGGTGRLLLSGGELDRKNQCFSGYGAEEFLSAYYADKSFISCRGLDRQAGATDGSAVSGGIRRLMLCHGRQRVLVLDRTKLDQINFYHICDLAEIGTLVVDRLPDGPWRKLLVREQIKVIETLEEEEQP